MYVISYNIISACFKCINPLICRLATTGHSGHVTEQYPPTNNHKLYFNIKHFRFLDFLLPNQVMSKSCFYSMILLLVDIFISRYFYPFQQQQTVLMVAHWPSVGGEIDMTTFVTRGSSQSAQL